LAKAAFLAVQGGFDLVIDGLVVLAHRAERPCLLLGCGAPDVTMVRGNFRIEDAPTGVIEPQLARLSPDSVTFDHAGLEVATLHLVTEGDALVVRVKATSSAHDRLTVRLAGDEGEHFWGGGEQMSYLDLAGRRFPMWTSEPGVGRDKSTMLTQKMDAEGMAGGDYWTTNYPQPTFLSSRGYAAHLRASCYSVLDFADATAPAIELWNNAAEIELVRGETPAALVSALASRFGRQPPLPDWAIGGAIVGLKDGANSFARLERIIAAGAQVSGLWCEDWIGIRQTSFGRRLFWDWQWNATRYPDLPEQIAGLTARGIRFLGYVNPYLAVDGPQFAQAQAQGYLALRQDNDDPYRVDFGEFDAGVVDFTNPAARDWFAEEIIGKQMLDFGLKGWMADFGEYLPVDLRLADGSDPMEAHNRWPVLWAQVNAQAVANRGMTGDAVFFMRAGFSGVQSHCPLLWAGDQCVDFTRHDGIGTVITAALSAGLVGNAYSHSDVGGYTSLHGNIRTTELLMRWCELGAFTPVMRTHEGNRPDDNLQIDSSAELLACFAGWTRVHAALAPYVRHLCDEAVATGLPAQRPLFLHYPDDPDCAAVQDQYLYGADLLVAPVIEEGAIARTVLLPGDETWVHVWTGQGYEPGRHEIAAPLGAPPAFYCAGSRFAPLFASLLAHRDGHA
jgi:sulfoquinovosidase